MTRRLLVFLGIALLAAQCSQEPKSQPAPKAELKTPQDKISYSIGATVAKNIKKQGVEVNLDILAQGLKDEMAGKPLMKDEEIGVTMKELQTQLMQKQVAAMKKMADENKKEGDAFLEANKKKEGVVTLPSGLEYKILKKGEGKIPTDKDTVEVNYKGTLINGKEFDSSQRTGKPATLKVDSIIPGWKEALKLMPVGSKWQLVIPSNLAYGEHGAGGIIPPNATLIFDVELLSIKEANGGNKVAPKPEAVAPKPEAKPEVKKEEPKAAPKPEVKKEEKKAK